MREPFRHQEFEPAEPRRDTEITLGPFMLLAMACGMVLVCAMFFGWGYAAGRRSGVRDAPVLTQSDAGQTLTVPPGGSAAKPSATSANAAIAAAEQPAAAATVMPSSAGAGSAAPSAPSASTPAPSPAPQEPSVRPAFAGGGGNVAAGGPAGTVQPALAQGSAIMVQIAAVSHAEDANVLVAALRKRGYAVSARRELGDNLIHVQIGPFATRAEANAMSQKLLGDGYNALVLP